MLPFYTLLIITTLFHATVQGACPRTPDPSEFLKAIVGFCSLPDAIEMEIESADCVNLPPTHQALLASYIAYFLIRSGLSFQSHVLECSDWSTCTTPKSQTVAKALYRSTCLYNSLPSELRPNDTCDATALYPDQPSTEAFQYYDKAHYLEAAFRKICAVDQRLAQAFYHHGKGAFRGGQMIKQASEGCRGCSLCQVLERLGEKEKGKVKAMVEWTKGVVAAVREVWDERDNVPQHLQ